VTTFEATRPFWDKVGIARGLRPLKVRPTSRTSDEIASLLAGVSEITHETDIVKRS